MLGGFTQYPSKADDYIQEVVEAHIQEIASKLKKPFTNYKPVSYKTQMVNGVNYKIKICLDNEDYIHVLIYVYTEEDGSASKLLTVITNQSEDSEI